MQDVTDLPFWKLMTRYGGADLYYTEYFRVHADSRLEKHIARSIVENPTGRPVVAQMIGNDIASLVRTPRGTRQLGTQWSSGGLADKGESLWPVSVYKGPRTKEHAVTGSRGGRAWDV